MADLSILFREQQFTERFGLRDQRGIEGQNKKAFNSGKTGNEGIQRILTKIVRRAGLILLLAEKLVPQGGTATSTIRPVS